MAEFSYFPSHTWLNVFTGERPAQNHAALANAKSVMNAGVAFLAAQGGEDHPRAAEIRKGCLRVAGGCLRAER